MGGSRRRAPAAPPWLRLVPAQQPLALTPSRGASSREREEEEGSFRRKEKGAHAACAAPRVVVVGPVGGFAVPASLRFSPTRWRWTLDRQGVGAPAAVPTLAHSLALGGSWVHLHPVHGSFWPRPGSHGFAGAASSTSSR